MRGKFWYQFCFNGVTVLTCVPWLKPGFKSLGTFLTFGYPSLVRNYVFVSLSVRSRSGRSVWCMAALSKSAAVCRAVGNETWMEVIHVIPAGLVREWNQCSPVDWYCKIVWHTKWMLMLVLYRFVGFARASLIIRNCSHHDETNKHINKILHTNIYNIYIYIILYNVIM